jgi:hypothetical protein
VDDRQGKLALTFGFLSVIPQGFCCLVCPKRRIEVLCRKLRLLAKTKLFHIGKINQASYLPLVLDQVIS